MGGYEIIVMQSCSLTAGRQVMQPACRQAGRASQ